MFVKRYYVEILIKQSFVPPAYRTVALFLEHCQADPSLQPSKVRAPSIRTTCLRSVGSLPEKKNALWSADATAHNELVFYNGRTNQYVYGVYVFDCASGKLLACEPYNTAERGVRASEPSTTSRPFRKWIVQNEILKVKSNIFILCYIVRLLKMYLFKDFPLYEASSRSLYVPLRRRLGGV